MIKKEVVMITRKHSLEYMERFDEENHFFEASTVKSEHEVNNSDVGLFLLMIKEKQLRAKSRDHLLVTGTKGQDLFVEMTSGQILHLQFQDGNLFKSRVVINQKFDEISAFAIL